MERLGVVCALAALFARLLFARKDIKILCIRVESELHVLARSPAEYADRATLFDRTILALDLAYLRATLQRNSVSYLAVHLSNWKHAIRCQGCDCAHVCAAQQLCPMRNKCIGSIRRHIAQCKVTHCVVPHCYITRRVVGHFKTCRRACALCEPFRVRETLTVLSSLPADRLRAHVASFPPPTDFGCVMCSETELVLPPPTYFCDGPCGAAIRRNALFSRSADNERHLCKPCAPAATLVRNDAVAVSATAVCESCGRGVHVVCALITGAAPKVVCPRCLLQTRERLRIDGGTVAPAPTNPVAYMEARVRAELPPEERGNVHVRALARTAFATQVDARARELFPDMPTELPGTESCFGLFNVIEGVEVLVFLFYALEYAADCPEPNRMRVYINYVDSVHYFRPKAHRTAVYQRMLLAYIQNASDRGFKTCHIWSCPPSRCDEYIFVGHPPEQKKPTKKKLLEWYLALARIDSLPVTLFADEFQSATPPYFAGDLWTLELSKAKTAAAARAALRHKHCLVLHLEGGAAPPATALFESVFMNRDSFIHFCRKNNLQFTTLLFAKYATAMLAGN